jgi:hypothetical protein
MHERGRHGRTPDRHTHLPMHWPFCLRAGWQECVEVEHGEVLIGCQS